MGDGGELDLTSEVKKDASTTTRETKLWNDSVAMANQDPFAAQYGPASAMPGMSNMGSASQKYLADSILGAGQIQHRDLGFTPEGEFQGYERPIDAPFPVRTQVDQVRNAAAYTAKMQEDKRRRDEAARIAQWKIDNPLSTLGPPPAKTVASSMASSKATPYTGGLLGRPGDPTRSGTVGVGEMEDAALATRRLLKQAGPADPDYKQFLTGGWAKQSAAGTGSTPGFSTDASGNLVPIADFGWSGTELKDPTYDAAGNVVTPGYRPGYDTISGPTSGEGSSPFGVEERDPLTLGSIDPATGLPRVDSENRLIGDIPAVTRGLISAQTGYGVQGIGQRIARDADGSPIYNPGDSGYMESALGLSAEERALSQIGQAAGPQQVFDPVTGEVRSAAERITGGDISPLGQFRDPDTGLVTDVMTPGAVTDPTLAGFTDPTTGERTFAGADYTDLTKSEFDVDAPEGLKDFEAVGGETTTDVGAVAPTVIGGPTGVTVNPLTGQVTEAVGAVGPGAIAGPGGLTVDPVTGQTTSAVGGVAPSEFGGTSFLGGPAMSDYMNVAGTEAAVTQARQDYEIALNREKARQAQVGAFGSRGTVEEAGLIDAQERNIAQIRGAGFDRAAQMMESDAARRQQAGLQSQQLGTQTGLAGQALEAQRRESDAARAQQAAMQGQQLGFQGQLQTQQLAQAGDIRGAELGLQAQMQGQQLEAQRRSEDAARAQQAALAGQQLGTQAQMQTQQLTQAGDIRGAELGLQAGMQGQQLQAQRREADAARAQQASLAGQQWERQAGMQTQQLGLQAGMQTAQNQLAAAQANQQAAIQTGSEAQRLEAQRQVDQAKMQLSAQQQTQQLGFQGGMQAQQLGQQANIRQAELDMEAARANQATALTSGSQTQQLEASREMRQAELNLQRQQQTQQLALQSGMQQAGFGQQAAIRQAELDLQREQGTQGLGAEAFMQQQQLGQQATMASASNALDAARADQQAALSSGNQAAALEAQRRGQAAQAQVNAAMQTQGLGADAAAQASQQEATRLQTLSEMGLQSGGMGLTADAQFRQQQMDAAQQLAGIGGMTQGATFAAGDQLQQMGAQQDVARRQQMAYDYEQWLRGQEGGAQALALQQSMMPGGAVQQWNRPPNIPGQIIGAATALGGAYIGRDRSGSDVRVKENITYAGTKNGFNVYDFNYLGGDNRYRGVMAQEVVKQRPDAVESRNGVYWVDYGALGIQMEDV